jgi:beta-1,4-mannooligosaccharide/beta-1,4-mannosyl-N-acetylglucosamine phosphorylase
MSWKRSPHNPILTRESLPEIAPDLIDPTSVFNPGAALHGDRTVLLLRVQSRGRRTFLLKATCDDGLHFRLSPTVVALKGFELEGETVHHVYDPRITRLEGSYYVMVAVDLDAGCRLGLARTDDFETLELIGEISDRDLRNGVLFPEKIGGRYVRLDRPNEMRPTHGPVSGSEIWLSSSDDLREWKPEGPVARGRPHYWDELIGSGPPPVKTRRGWLHVYHGVATHFASSNVYQAGALLLDLADPSKVLARSRNNCLEPREPYELVGQVPNVVFPTGLVVDRYDDEGFALEESEIRLYYGAADTCVGLATATVGDALAMCED